MAEDKRVDEGWKKRAQAEKQKASANTKADASSKGAPDGLPQASFIHFASTLATQVLMALGQVQHPSTGQKQVNLPEAKYLIDIIKMLEEKTKGNLTEDEAKSFKEVLYNLQMAYVAVSKKSGAQ